MCFQGSGPEAIEGAEPVSLSSPAIDETPGEPEVNYVKYYPEPDLPTERSRHIIPTYVDYHGNIFAQEYKDGEKYLMFSIRDLI